MSFSAMLIDVYDRCTVNTPRGTMTIAEALDRIRDGEWDLDVQEVRDIRPGEHSPEVHAARAAAKNSCLASCLAVDVSRRAPKPTSPSIVEGWKETLTTARTFPTSAAPLSRTRSRRGAFSRSREPGSKSVCTVRPSPMMLPASAGGRQRQRTTPRAMS